MPNRRTLQKVQVYVLLFAYLTPALLLGGLSSGAILYAIIPLLVSIACIYWIRSNCLASACAFALLTSAYAWVGFVLVQGIASAMGPHGGNGWPVVLDCLRIAVIYVGVPTFLVVLAVAHIWCIKGVPDQ